MSACYRTDWNVCADPQCAKTCRYTRIAGDARVVEYPDFDAWASKKYPLQWLERESDPGIKAMVDFGREAWEARCASSAAHDANFRPFGSTTFADGHAWDLGRRFYAGGDAGYADLWRCQRCRAETRDDPGMRRVVHPPCAGSPSNGLSPQDDALKAMEKRKDDAYEERNRVVAALAWMGLHAGWKAGIAITNIEGWSPDWHNCVYIDLPTGQVSWHYHDSHAPLFDGLPRYESQWDGHDTPEKYHRVARLGNRIALASPPVVSRQGQTPRADALVRELQRIKASDWTIDLIALAQALERALEWAAEELRRRGYTNTAAQALHMAGVDVTPKRQIPPNAEAALEREGVFKGASGLRGLAHADKFWEDRMYGTRLYYGPGGGDYLHRSVLRAAVQALDRLDEQGRCGDCGMTVTRKPNGIVVLDEQPKVGDPK